MSDNTRADLAGHVGVVGPGVSPQAPNVSALTHVYSEEFEQMVIDLHRGKERPPAYEDYIADHLGAPDSRLDRFERHLYPEIRFHCGALEAKRVLDFGCGTGSTTAMLALHCERLTAFGIDERSVAISIRRLQEHRLHDKVRVLNRQLEEAAL